MQEIKLLLNRLEKTPHDLYNRDFLLTWEKSHNDLQAVLIIAEILRKLREQNISTRIFESGVGVSVFRDKSTRTRFSFASACNLLGLSVQDLDEEKSQISHGETVRETTAMISFLTEAIGIRDDIFLGKGHSYMLEVSKALNECYENNILPQRPALINLQSDIDHPTQTMADLLHLIHYFGGIENLYGKKLAVTWAYSPSYGKPLSVPQGIIGLMTRYGMHVELAYPEGYELLPEVMDVAFRNALESGGSFTVSHKMEQAFTDADIVYPKSWAPFHIMKKRTELFENNNAEALKELEKQGLANNARFIDWECNREKMKLTRNGKALYMHCLPADISGVSCPRGEVSAEVFEEYRAETYREAGCKPYIIAAMILAQRIPDVAKVLEECIRAQNPRIRFI